MTKNCYKCGTKYKKVNVVLFECPKCGLGVRNAYCPVCKVDMIVRNYDTGPFICPKCKKKSIQKCLYRCDWCGEPMEVEKKLLGRTGGPFFCNGECVINHTMCYGG